MSDELPKLAKMGLDFRKLQSYPEWGSVVVLISEIRKKCAFSLLKFGENADLETIAFERVMYAGMAKGVEAFLSDMQVAMNELKKYEEKENESAKGKN